MAQVKPSKQQTALSRFAGKWRGEAKFSLSPWHDKAGQGSLKLELKTALDGFFVFGDWEDKRGSEIYRAHLVFAWSLRGNAHQVYWFDSMGGSGPPFVGNLEGDTLVVEREGPQGITRCRWSLKKAELQIELSHATDGTTFAPFVEATCKKA